MVRPKPTITACRSGSYTEHHESIRFESWQSHFLSGSREYDVVLSDLTLGNVPYDERGELYKEIQAALTPGGVFIDKVLTNRKLRYTTRDIQRLFEYAPINLRTVNDFNCAAIFCGERTGPDFSILNAARSYERLAFEFSSSKTITKLIALCRDLTPEGMSWYYGKEWCDVQREYIGLRPVAVHEQPRSSPYYGHAQQFVFRKEL